TRSCGQRNCRSSSRVRAEAGADSWSCLDNRDFLRIAFDGGRNPVEATEGYSHSLQGASWNVGASRWAASQRRHDGGESRKRVGTRFLLRVGSVAARRLDEGASRMVSVRSANARAQQEGA